MSNNFDDDITNNILDKTTKFFKVYKTVKKSNLNDFLESTNLISIFGSSEEEEILWDLLQKSSDNKENINLETCKKVLRSLLDPNSNEENKEGDINSLIDRISLLKERLSAIGHNVVRNNTCKDNNKENHIHLVSIIQEQSLEKLQEYRKVFSLLDLSRKKEIYISEIQDFIARYKFINLTQNEIIHFISLVSTSGKDEYAIDNDDSEKFTINFELYSKAIAKLEQQILTMDEAETFEKNNDSYEINVNPQEMLDEIMNAEQ